MKKVSKYDVCLLCSLLFGGLLAIATGIVEIIICSEVIWLRVTTVIILLITLLLILSSYVIDVTEGIVDCFRLRKKK